MKFHSFHIVIITLLLFAMEQIKAEKTIKQTTHLEKVVMTAKERLGTKASDNQRVNNCKVPVEKRGSKPRPDQCHRGNR